MKVSAADHRRPAAQHRRLQVARLPGAEGEGQDRRRPRGARLPARRGREADDPLHQAQERGGQGLPAARQEPLVLRPQRGQVGAAHRARAHRRHRLAAARTSTSRAWPRSTTRTYEGEEKLGKFDVHKLTLKAKPGVDVAYPVVQAVGGQGDRQHPQAPGVRALRPADAHRATTRSGRSSSASRRRRDVWFPQEIRFYDEVEKANSTAGAHQVAWTCARSRPTSSPRPGSRVEEPMSRATATSPCGARPGRPRRRSRPRTAPSEEDSSSAKPAAPPATSRPAGDALPGARAGRAGAPAPTRSSGRARRAAPPRSGFGAPTEAAEDPLKIGGQFYLRAAPSGSGDVLPRQLALLRAHPAWTATSTPAPRPGARLRAGRAQRRPRSVPRAPAGHRRRPADLGSAARGPRPGVAALRHRAHRVRHRRASST